MPCRKTTSFKDLDETFGGISREQRAMMSKQLLAAIGEDDRTHLRNWAEVEVKKPSGIPDSMFHLLVFYALAFVAKVPRMLQATLDAIIGKGTIVGVIVPV